MSLFVLSPSGDEANASPAIPARVYRGGVFADSTGNASFYLLSRSTSTGLAQTDARAPLSTSGDGNVPPPVIYQQIVFGSETQPFWAFLAAPPSSGGDRGESSLYVVNGQQVQTFRARTGIWSEGALTPLSSSTAFVYLRNGSHPEFYLLTQNGLQSLQSHSSFPIVNARVRTLGHDLVVAFNEFQYAVLKIDAGNSTLTELNRNQHHYQRFLDFVSDGNNEGRSLVFDAGTNDVLSMDFRLGSNGWSFVPHNVHTLFLRGQLRDEEIQAVALPFDPATQRHSLLMRVANDLMHFDPFGILHPPAPGHGGLFDVKHLPSQLNLQNPVQQDESAMWLPLTQKTFSVPAVKISVPRLFYGNAIQDTQHKAHFVLTSYTPSSSVAPVYDLQPTDLGIEEMKFYGQALLGENVAAPLWFFTTSDNKNTSPKLDVWLTRPKRIGEKQSVKVATLSQLDGQIAALNPVQLLTLDAGSFGYVETRGEITHHPKIGSAQHHGLAIAMKRVSPQHIGVLYLDGFRLFHVDLQAEASKRVQPVLHIPNPRWDELLDFSGNESHLWLLYRRSDVTYAKLYALGGPEGVTELRSTPIANRNDESIQAMGIDNEQQLQLRLGNDLLLLDSHNHTQRIANVTVLPGIFASLGYRLSNHRYPGFLLPPDEGSHPSPASLPPSAVHASEAAPPHMAIVDPEKEPERIGEYIERLIARENRQRSGKNKLEFADLSEAALLETLLRQIDWADRLWRPRGHGVGKIDPRYFRIFGFSVNSWGDFFAEKPQTMVKKNDFLQAFQEALRDAQRCDVRLSY